MECWGWGLPGLMQEQLGAEEEEDGQHAGTRPPSETFSPGSLETSNLRRKGAGEDHKPRCKTRAVKVNCFTCKLFQHTALQKLLQWCVREVAQQTEAVNGLQQLKRRYFGQIGDQDSAQTIEKPAAARNPTKTSKLQTRKMCLFYSSKTSKLTAVPVFNCDQPISVLLLLLSVFADRPRR